MFILTISDVFIWELLDIDPLAQQNKQRRLSTNRGNFRWPRWTEMSRIDRTKEFIRKGRICLNKKISVGMSLALMLIAVAVTVSVTITVSWRMFNNTVADVTERQAMYAKLSETDGIIRENYLSTINEDKLNDALVAGYIKGLGDQYSAYIPAEETDELNNKNEGKGSGIGVNCVQHPDTGNIYITLVHDGSSAQTAGLQVGDSIVVVDSQSIQNVGYEKAVELLKGDVGSKCTLQILRGETTLTATVTRKVFEAQTVSSHIIGDIGVMRITSFATNTDKQFKKQLALLQNQQIKGLVMDLRNNFGGTLSSAQAILDILLPSGNLYTTVYSDQRTETHESDEACVDFPVAVLINGHTASASEMFAAAIRDFNKGPLIGNKTYGKGVMQRTYTLSDRSSVVLTIAHFNPPNGINFDGVGIQPDIPVDLSEEQIRNFYLLSAQDDPQLQMALDQLKNS